MSTFTARSLHGALAALTLLARGAVRLRLSGRRRPPRPPERGPLRVLLLAHAPADQTGTKYRVLHWARRLRERGHRVDVEFPMAPDAGKRLLHDWSPRARAGYHLRVLGSRLRTLLAGRRYDVGVIRMSDLPRWEYGPPFVARALRRLCGRLLLDLDDLPVVGGETTVRPRVRELVRTVDGLVLGNPELVDHLPPRPAWIVPTCVEPREWGPSASASPPILGWVGTAGNLRHLETLAGVLAEVCREHGARVRVVSNEAPRLPGVPVDFVRWSAEREQEDLGGLAIGLAPLADGSRERCKCGLKALQYMAAGVPVVASPVGALARIVEPGVTGALPETPVEWREDLDRLLADAALRSEMGAAGRARAAREYSFDAFEDRFEAALRGRGPDATTAPA